MVVAEVGVRLDLVLALSVGVAEDRALRTEHVAQRRDDRIRSAQDPANLPQRGVDQHLVAGFEADRQEIGGKTPACRRRRLRQLAAPA